FRFAVGLRCRVRYDLRGASVASGGQGAPTTPLADFVLFASDDAPALVMNLGGFINVTFVPRRGEGIAAIRGFDVCACNHLLDRVARTRLGAAFDADGAAAARGRCDDALARRIADAIAPHSAPGAARRSLGTGDEAARLVELTAALGPEDACRTVVEAIAEAAARTIADAAADAPRTLLLAGGSARNQALADALARRTGARVASTERSHGMPVHMREAAGIAVLGAMADDGVRYSLPAATGCAPLVPEGAVIGETA
ncbi:MAG: anhydro-N-acetylmuramic acid kinase, partial [Planctomycetota bacterium]